MKLDFHLNINGKIKNSPTANSYSPSPHLLSLVGFQNSLSVVYDNITHNKYSWFYSSKSTLSV